MLPCRLRFRCLPLLVLFATSFAQLRAEAPSPKPANTLALDSLGKDAVAIDGPWQFHLGDNPAWASPAFDDTQWEQLTADKTWGAQTHPSYTGFAWYRRSITITPAPGAGPDFALLIPAIDDAYQLYWNGVEIGHLGTMPPHLDVYQGVPPQTFGLGPVRSGVLAIRVYKLPLASNDPANLGGFEGLPLIGSPGAIAAAKGNIDFQWLRGQQFTFGLISLYALVSLLSFIAWMRDRDQWLLFWMTIFASMPALSVALVGLRLPLSFAPQQTLVQASIALREASGWFLLIWLMQLHEYRGLVRTTRILTIIGIIAATADGFLAILYPSVIGQTFYQIGDAILTCPALAFEAIPTVLVVFAIVKRKRLDSARWMVAGITFLNATLYWISNITAQGVRYTHWTVADKINAPLFTLNGNPFNVPTILRTLLFFSIVYAVIRYTIAERRRQATFELEIQNARELQQVLVPEAMPALAGFSLTSAYRPAQEVGGDFFQILPLENGSTLVVLGDVSGKGLRAAMAVSMIVGAVRTLVENSSSPAEILAGLNRRLVGRLQGGFATAIALRLDGDGSCTLACAGHPAPYVNDRELSFPGALPLGIAPNTTFEETRLQLRELDQLALYTDGLLEARSQSGELYSFDRLKTLFSTRPTADQAAQAAVNFGQDDDITVLTLTRLAATT
jgi:hypothetical protein